ncbi:hypothetical protein MKW98_003619 [Papaver atlanticum]|uniref:Uncharacterized protein n=1 Tax=Papaver atlanticum TaxID=357466 RepID=A0AAD4XF80_9MAGN|nr:hypothetical protein MKW98_003619 [Papaver atlanticum]
MPILGNQQQTQPHTCYNVPTPEAANPVVEQNLSVTGAQTPNDQRQHLYLSDRNDETVSREPEAPEGDNCLILGDYVCGGWIIQPASWPWLPGTEINLKTRYSQEDGGGDFSGRNDLEIVTCCFSWSNKV